MLRARGGTPRASDRQAGVPILLLASLGDRLVSPRCSERIARAWNAPLRMRPDAGHDLPLDDPDWVLGQLLDWHARQDEL